MKISYIRQQATRLAGRGVVLVAVLAMGGALLACNKEKGGDSSGQSGATGGESGQGAAATTPEKDKPQNGATSGAETETPARPDLAAKARELAQRFIIVDGHIDLPIRLQSVEKKTGAIPYEGVITGLDDGDFDIPRAVAGGLNAPFMSIYVSAKFQETGGAKKAADTMIDMVETLVKTAPDKVAIARTVADVRKHKAEGKVSLPMGIENGAAIEDDLGNLKHFYDRGIRYITLTHSKVNDICDSSYDETRTWKGLSPFGEKVIAEMNRLGIMIDVSHISDDTFDQVMKLTRTPVIASHSSARHFLPGFERNMSDAMIKELARNGGVIMINFGSTFISQTSREAGDKRRAVITKFAEDNKLEYGDPKLMDFIEELSAKEPFTFADVSDVADHIDHVVKLVGVDHVGLGSDFDGVGDTLPTKLKDASMFPALIQVLLERGYSDEDIEKICSGNVFRVWKAVEDHAASQK